MQTAFAMVSKKNVNKVLKSAIQSAIAVMPAIPFIARRRKSMVMSYVLGGIGVALVGGLAAMMFFSPRMRYRAIDAAKNTYGKLGSRVLHKGTDLGAMQDVSNGLSSEYGGTGYSPTGL